MRTITTRRDAGTHTAEARAFVTRTHSTDEGSTAFKASVAIKPPVVLCPFGEGVDGHIPELRV
jgi:hypothetical protein